MRRGNHEGSIYKDAQGRWRGVITLYSTDGKSKKKYLYGRTKREVTEKMKKMQLEILSGNYIEPDHTTLYSYLCTWLDTYCRTEVRATTLINYETYIKRHIQPAIGKIQMNELNAFTLQQFYNDLLKHGNLLREGGLSPKTLRNLHNMLHKALGQAVSLGILSKNPADLVVLPRRTKQERKFFTVEEQQTLQACLPTERLGMAVLLDLYTGMRQGELLGMMWKDVHIDLNGQSYLRVTQTLNRILTNDPNSRNRTELAIGIPKTAHSVRIIPLLPEIAEKLLEYQKQQADHYRENGITPNGFVFTNKDGGLIDPKNFQSAFKSMLKRNGIRVINVHGLRHTFATRALESGMSVKTLSKVLGHANAGFTMDTYMHVTESLKADEMENLQKFLE